MGWTMAADGGCQDVRMRQSSDMWYNHRMYSRFWQHYQQAMGWLQKHRRAYHKAIRSFEHSPWYSTESTASHFTDWHHGSSYYSSRCAQQDDLNQSKWQQSPYSTDNEEENLKDIADISSDTEVESDTENELECDVSNVEITEELRQYFEQTEKHREELIQGWLLCHDEATFSVEGQHLIFCLRSFQPDNMNIDFSFRATTAV
ncbi:gem-associated protein 8 isoform X3 [Hypanus sabinus]|uniref:gem-associated protein 8 isoform X3 n=1 Tax=Hypanus sabinus TaxID=79690 RepID=UPI0028C4C23C|nr:gem-associated protein 8 isoform X3 [Hypanus sabinus]